MLNNELVKGLASAFEWLDVKDDRPAQIRPDFGTGLVSSVFGARIECPSDNPPWVHPLSEGDVEWNIRSAIDGLDLADVPNRGLIPRVAETYSFYADILATYPNVRSFLAVIMPDIQGPFDTAAMLWGSSIFEALYTNPELVDRLCSAVADVMIALHTYFRTFIGRELLPEGFSHTHGVIIRGNYLMRGDSNLMLSNAMYREQMLPHELKVLKVIGGGSYHSCGNWEHNIGTILALDEIGSLDFGSNQSQMNDIDGIYRQAAKAKKHLNLVTAYSHELASGSIIQRFPTGVTLSCQVENKEEAARVIQGAGRHGGLDAEPLQSLVNPVLLNHFPTSEKARRLRRVSWYLQPRGESIPNSISDQAGKNYIRLCSSRLMPRLQPQELA
ncbi:MAG: hypothetical protein FJW26_05025 [Acidimicrobiia bacterium]|nr:hypothetical protein [Acidimicrobiia bacterium]